MQFRPRKRRQPPAVIIVALIDILVVLVIFLIVTTTFKQRPTLRLSLPESKRAQAGANENHATLIVEVDKQPPYLRFEGRVLTLEALTEELKRRMAQEPRLGLGIRSDAQAPIEQIIKVMDAARDAQMTNYSMFMKGPGDK